MERCEAGEVGSAAPLRFPDKLLVLGPHQLARYAKRDREREKRDEGVHRVLVVKHLALSRPWRSPGLPPNSIVSHGDRDCFRESKESALHNHTASGRVVDDC